MPFNLEISFAGMCMLVRDSDAAGNPRMLHVLMPDTGANTHLPTVAYRTAYEVGSPNPAPVTKHDMAGEQMLDLEALSGSNGFDLTMPKEAFDFEGSPLGTRRVPRALLDDLSLPSGVVFRTRLKAGRHAGPHPGGFWLVRISGVETSHRMATLVNWRVEDVPLTTLKLNLGRNGVHELTPLPGPDGKLAIHLMIVNLTPSEHARLGSTVTSPSHCLPHRHSGHHFTHYFPLLSPTPPNVVPQFDKTRTKGEGACIDPPPPIDAREFDEAGTRAGSYGDAQPAAAGSLQAVAARALFAGGSEFTCMVTTARAVP